MRHTSGYLLSQGHLPSFIPNELLMFFSLSLSLSSFVHFQSNNWKCIFVQGITVMFSFYTYWPITRLLSSQIHIPLSPVLYVLSLLSSSDLANQRERGSGVMVRWWGWRLPDNWPEFWQTSSGSEYLWPPTHYWDWTGSSVSCWRAIILNISIHFCWNYPSLGQAWKKKHCFNKS